MTGYTVNDGNSGNDYTVTTATATGTITPAALTISATTDSKVYDGTIASSKTPTTSTLYDGDTVTASQAFSSKNVLGTSGSTLVVTGYTVNDGNGGKDYTVTTATATGTITPAALTIAATTDSKVYNGTTTSSKAPTASTLYDGDTVSGTQAFTSKNVLGTGGSTLVVTGYTINDGNGGNDYTVTAVVTATGTITPAALTISATTDSKVYDGTTTSANTPTTSTLYDGDTVTASQAFTSKNVLGAGNSTLAVTSYTVNDGNGGADYTVTTATATGTITPAALTISATTDSKVYDGTVASSKTPTTSTLYDGDTVTANQAFSSKNVLGTGASTLVVTGYTVKDGNGGADYTVTTATATGTITPAALTISATTDTKVYDGTVASSKTPTTSTLYDGDTVTASQAFASKNVLGTGASTLAVTGYTVNDGNGGADYTVATATATGTITPAALTISATTDSKIYDGTTTSAKTPTTSTLYDGDTVTASQAFSSKNVLGTGASTLVVTGYTVNDGNGGADYTVTTATATGTITPAALTISATTDSKVYDGTTTSAKTPTTGTLYDGDTVTASQAFSSKNVLGAGGSTLAVTGYTVNDGNGGNDYTVTTATATGTITPAALTISATTDSKVYDGTTTSSKTPTTSTLYDGDTVTASQAFSSKNVLGTGASTLVVTGYTVKDGDGGNDYTVTTATATGTITPAALTISATSDTKVYDGTTASSKTPTTSTLYDGDTVTATQAFTSPDPLGTGNSTLVVTSYTVNDGNGGNDYTVTTQAASGTIFPPAPTVPFGLSLDAGSDSSGGFDITSDTTPYIDGYTDPGVTVNLYIGSTYNNIDYSTVVGTGTSNSSGFFSIQIDPGNGAYVVAAEAANSDGITSDPSTAANSAGFVVDTTVPTFNSGDQTGPQTMNVEDELVIPIPVNAFSDAFVGSENGVANNTLFYGVSYTDPSNVIQDAYIQQNSDQNGNTTYDLVIDSTGNQGTAAFAITANNVAGDQETDGGDQFNVTVAQTPFQVQINLSQDQGGNASTVSVNGTVNLISSVTGGGANDSYSYSWSISPENGGGYSLPGGADNTEPYFAFQPTSSDTYAVTLAVTDATGSTETTTDDITVPMVTNLTPSQPSINANAPLTLTGYINDQAGIVGTETTTIAWGDGNTSTIDGSSLTYVSPGLYSFSIQHTYAPSAEGTNTISVTATDGTTPIATDTESISENVTAADVYVQYITAANKTYDGTTTATITGYQLTGVNAGDQVFLAWTAANFDTKDEGAGKTVTATGLSLYGNQAYEYTLVQSSATTTASITPAALTIYATSDSKVYDGTTTSSKTPTTSTLYDGDTVTAGQAFTSKNVLGTGGSTLMVTGYTVNDGDGGADYIVTTATATGTITPAALTISATTDTKVYDGTTTSSKTPTTSTLYDGDTVTASQAFTSKNVLGAGNSTLVVTGYTVNDGDGGADYTVTTATAAGTITPAALTIFATTDSKVYDGTTTSSKTPTTSTLYDGDTVTASQAFLSKNVMGTNSSTLVVTGYTVNDGDNGADYTVTTATATGTITPAALTIFATSDSKVYDGTTTSSKTPTTSTLYDGDTVTASQAFASKNVLGTGASTLVVTGYTVNDGDNGADYTVTTVTATGTITPAALTISATTDSKVYDGTTTSAKTPTTSTLYDGDTVTASQAFTSKNVLGTGGSTLVVTGYTVNDGDNGADYTVTTVTAAGTITPAALTISATTDSKVYDGTTTSAKTPTTSTLYDGDTVTASQAFTSKNVLGAGHSTLVVTGYTVNDGDNGADYTVTTATAAGTITPAALTISATTDSKVYDGTTTSSKTPTTSTLYDGDTVTASQAFTSKNVLGAGNSTLVVTGYTVNDGDGGKDYTVTTATAAGTITPAALTIFATTDTKVYDGTTTSAKAPTTSTLYDGDTVTASQVFMSKNVLGAGNSTLAVSGYTVNDGNGGNDYTVRVMTATGTITPAALTISATTDTKVYDGTTTSSKTPTTSTLYDGDTVTASQAFTSKNVLGTGNSTLVVTGYTVNDSNGGKDYTVTTVTATGTITPAALTISATTDSKVYDGTIASSKTPTTSTLYDGDTVTASQAFTSKNVLGTGASTLVVTGYTVNDGDNGADYTVTTATATGTITPAALTISATSDTKVYDGTTTSAKTPTTSTLYDGDTVTASQAFASKNVLGAGASTLLVTGYTVNDGDNGADYTVTTATATGTITPAALTISATSDSKVYDGTTTSSKTPTTSTLYDGDTVTASQAFASKNVLGTSGSTLVVTGYTVNDGDNGADYIVTTATATGTITPAALTISATTDSKVYDGTTTSAKTPTTSTLYDGDTVTASQAFTSKNVLGTGASTLVVTSYTVNDGDNGADYTVTTATAAGTITPAALTIFATTDSKVYDGTTASSKTPTTSTLYDGDTVTASQAFASKNVLGSGGSTLVVTGYTVNDGDGGADYTVTTVTAAGTITPAALTISATTDTKVYDGTTTSAKTPTTSTLYDGDTVTASQAFASKNVLGAGGSTLVVTGYTVNDGDNGADYTVTTATATGTITPAALTISATTDSKVYDGTIASSKTPTTSTLYDGDTVTASQAFASKNVLVPAAARWW